MKPLVVGAVIVILGAEAARPALADAGNTKKITRTTVVVARGWPVKRAQHSVVVRPVSLTERPVPKVFLEPLVFRVAALKSVPPRDAMVWEDSDVLTKVEDWTEMRFDCDTRGKRLDLEITGGKAQLDWAEVVFDNGDTQVVDFGEKSQGEGLFVLLAFEDGRRIDHIRMIGRSRTEETKVTVRLER